MIDPLLTADDVARILGIAPKTVQKLARERRLPCVQVTSNCRRFESHRIEQYIESHSTQTIDKKTNRGLPSPHKGGEKSIGVSGTDLRKEMRSW
jgi:excisionase family DNA binding protein